MANDSNKKMEQKNKELIAQMKKWLTWYWIVYPIIRLLLFKFLRVMQIIMSIATFFAAKYIFRLFSFFAQPKYKDGKLSQSQDITKGYLTYLHDILYVSHFCLFLSLFHRRLTYSFLVIPIAALIILWQKVISPWIFKSTIDPNTMREAEMQRQMMLQGKRK